MNIETKSRTIGDETASQFWWFVNGSLVNFTSGYTFVGKLATTGDLSTVLFTKTTGFTGAAGSGIGALAADVPNLSVTWATTGELNSLTAAGLYKFQIVATKTSDNSEETLWVYFNMDKRLG